MADNEDRQGLDQDQFGRQIDEVDSLYEAFEEDFKRQLEELPRVADLMERRQQGERLEIVLTPDEIAKLHATMLWLMKGWVGNLAREVDRLHDLLDDQAAIGNDDANEQGDASRQ